MTLQGGSNTTIHNTPPTDKVGNICCKQGKEVKRTYGSSGKTRRNKPLRKPSGRWEGDFKMEIKATGWESMAWINLPMHMNK